MFALLLLFLLLYVLICVYSLGLRSCYVLKHVRLLEFLFRSSTLFFVLLGFLGWIPRAYNHACTRKLDYAHASLFMRVHDLAQKP